MGQFSVLSKKQLLLSKLSTPPKRSSGISVSKHQSEAIGSTLMTWLQLYEKVIKKLMLCAKNLPEAAFFSAEEKVQLLSGNYPRNLTKERLKE